MTTFSLGGLALAVAEHRITSNDNVSVPGSNGAVHSVGFGWADGGEPFLSCSCPAWRYRKLALSERSCKHTTRVAIEMGVEGSWPWHVGVSWTTVDGFSAAHPPENEVCGVFELPDDLPDWLRDLATGAQP